MRCVLTLLHYSLNTSREGHKAYSMKEIHATECANTFLWSNFSTSCPITFFSTFIKELHEILRKCPICLTEIFNPISKWAVLMLSEVFWPQKNPQEGAFPVRLENCKTVLSELPITYIWKTSCISLWNSSCHREINRMAIKEINLF